ncbi:hypothetical protein BKA69DRAFT_837208 [Paraphysoderma sedebokerense]|nr:hypothetical protein BKA69DRAFT_837208 [Paraphysoderma sedebokerense]
MARLKISSTFPPPKKYVPLTILACLTSIVMVTVVVVTTITLLPRTDATLLPMTTSAKNMSSYAFRNISSTTDVTIAPSSPKISKFLVVFFPGTTAAPRDYTTFLTYLATTNHHRVIGLPYNNNVSAFVYCRNSASTSGCYEAMRDNQIFGTISNQLDELVQRGYRVTDSQLVVANRLKNVLIELHEKYPQDRWSDFIQVSSSETDVRWDRVLAMGHSQGAAIAAYLGTHRRIAGVRLFAGPSDVYSDGIPAAYLSSSSTTTKSLWRTFRSRYDLFCNAVASITSALGYHDYGAPLDIAPPPATELNHYTNDFCSNSCFNTIPKENMPMTTHSNFIQDVWLNGTGGIKQWCFDYKLLWEEFGKVEECDQVNCSGEFYCNPALGCIKKDKIYRNETSGGCQCRRP